MDAPRSSPARTADLRPRSGWLSFAGTLFVLVGAFNIVDGLVALLKDEAFAVTKDGLLFLDYTAWGWFFLILGVVQILVGFGIYAGRGWARVVGVLLAMLNTVGQIAFLVAFPLWALITIALNVLVIYGLMVPYGSEQEKYSRVIE
jgi:hypothetical protein